MKGISFPIRLSGSGGLKMTENNKHIEDDLAILVNTKKFERVMNPELGNTLDGSIFENDDVSIESLLKFELVNIFQNEGFEITSKDIEIYKDNDETTIAIVTYKDIVLNIPLG